MSNFKSKITWVICSSVFIILLGVLWHYLYSLFGEATFIGYIAPVNESVWEHIKLSIWPVFIIWLLVSPFFQVPEPISNSKAIVCAVATMILSILIVWAIHYICKAGFDTEAMYIDVLSYIIGIVVGQVWTAIHLLGIDIPIWISYLCYVIAIVAVIWVAYLTFNPCDYPIFADPNASGGGVKGKTV